MNEWLQIYLEREFLLVRIDETHQLQSPEHSEGLRAALVRAEAIIEENKL